MLRRHRAGWREQLALQRRVVEFRRHRPGDAHHRRAAQILGDRVAADPDRGGDPVAALAAEILEAKNFSNLTHRQSLGWHGAPLGSGRQHAVAGRLPSDRAANPFKSGWLASESVAALRRNHRLDSIGMPGCFASERAIPAGRQAKKLPVVLSTREVAQFLVPSTT